MHPALSVALASLVPLFCLGLLLWLARLEETLDRDVKATARRPEPAPVRAVPVSAPVQTTPAPVRSADEPVSVPDVPTSPVPVAVAATA
jgi:hypothetical protein